MKNEEDNLWGDNVEEVYNVEEASKLTNTKVKCLLPSISHKRLGIVLKAKAFHYTNLVHPMLLRNDSRNRIGKMISHRKIANRSGLVVGSNKRCKSVMQINTGSIMNKKAIQKEDLVARAYKRTNYRFTRNALPKSFTIKAIPNTIKLRTQYRIGFYHKLVLYLVKK